MVIAKPEWFKRRKYFGWGAYPATWQGWVYTILIIVPFIIFQALPFWDQHTRFIVTLVWAGIIFVDIMDVMIRMRRDERDNMHEALAERNALWAIIIILGAGIAYQAASGIVRSTIYVDPVIIIALVVGLIVKAVSNIYLDRKD